MEVQVVVSASVALGAELRRIREHSGLSGSEAARQLGWSQPRLSRVETGRYRVAVHDVAALLDFYGVAEEVCAELISMAAGDGDVPGAWIVRAGGPRRRQADVGDIEGRAVRVRQFQPMAVPGLLQANEYTRSFGHAIGDPDPDDLTVRRAARRAAFAARTDVWYEVVLAAAVLERWPGERGVMVEQLQALIDASDRENLDLLVQTDLRTVAAFAMSSFLVYEFSSQAPNIVMVETQTADLYLSATADTVAYARLFDRLQADSLSPSDTRDYLEGVLRRLKRGR